MERRSVAGLIKTVLTLPYIKLRRSLDLPLQLKNLTFAVTYACNSKCAMCDIWRTYQQDPQGRANELSTSEIQAVFSDTAFFKHVRFVQLTGGEPFLRDDLVDIAQAIHDCVPSSVIYINTNGYLTDRIARSVEEILAFHQPLQIGISLDGLEATHDAQRGFQGAYTAAHATLSLLKQRYTELPVQVTMTITPHNVKDVLPLYSAMKGTSDVFQICIANVAKYYGNTDTAFDFSASEKMFLAECVHQLKYELVSAKTRVFSLSDQIWLDGNIHMLNRDGERLTPCYAGFHSLFLDPYGSIFPCLAYAEEIGNVRQESLATLWRSRRFKDVRGAIRREQCALCWLAHDIYPSITTDVLCMLKYVLMGERCAKCGNRLCSECIRIFLSDLELA
jgi:MoaA/NifB/PqqE/SkfB family radical SAM enzyme